MTAKTTTRARITYCALCGQELFNEARLCPHHQAGGQDGWAAVNRIMCDFLHRGIVPARLSVAQRASELATHAADAA